MTDDEWQALFENFETRWLLDAIGDIDTLRSHLSEDGRDQPPASATSSSRCISSRWLW